VLATEAAHTSCNLNRRPESIMMKPLWTQTLLWLAAAAAAVLLALASPDTVDLDAGETFFPAPAVAPR
jgi:hypothetical protein